MNMTFILCRKCLRRIGCRGTPSLTTTMGQSMACRQRTAGNVNNSRLAENYSLVGCKKGAECLPLFFF
jgi:hypothetical protein